MTGVKAMVLWCAAFAFVVWLFRSDHRTPPIPTIVTVHDTIHDTVRIAAPAPKKGAPNLVFRETQHDRATLDVGGTLIPLGPPLDTTPRPDVWPVASVEVGRRVGDTTRVNTFNQRTGRASSSALFTPGPLLGVWADTSPTPRLEFGPAPRQRTPLLTKLAWGGGGYAACGVVSGITTLLHGRRR